MNERATNTERPGADHETGADERLLTKQEMADRLQVDLRTVERWMAMGVLQPLRILGVVRFDWAEELERLKGSHAGQGSSDRAKCEVTGARSETANTEHRTSNAQHPSTAARKAACAARGGQR